MDFITSFFISEACVDETCIYPLLPTHAIVGIRTIEEERGSYITICLFYI